MSIVCLNQLISDAVDEVSLIFAACRETKFPGFTIKTKLAESFDFANLNLHELGEPADSTNRPDAEAPTVPADSAQPAYSFSSRFSREVLDQVREAALDEVSEALDSSASNTN